MELLCTRPVILIPTVHVRIGTGHTVHMRTNVRNTEIEVSEQYFWYSYKEGVREIVIFSHGQEVSVLSFSVICESVTLVAQFWVVLTVPRRLASQRHDLVLHDNFTLFYYREIIIFIILWQMFHCTVFHIYLPDVLSWLTQRNFNPLSVLVKQYSRSIRNLYSLFTVCILS